MAQDDLTRALEALRQQVDAACACTGLDDLRSALESVSIAARRLQHEREQLLEKQNELMRRNAKLADDVGARDALLSVIGHELRNPISPLFMHVRALQLETRQASDGKIDAAWLARRLERLEPHMQRFLAVLDRILDLSHLRSGRLDLVLEELDLAEVVADVVNRFQVQAAAAGCELHLRQHGPIVARWDRVRLEQIVSNLVSNAIRYGAGAPIDVNVSASERAAVIQVRDRGIGIAADDQSRIFDQFERAKQRRTQGGLGVGLWVVKTLCDAFGGTVTVDSAPNQGATFTVTLPRGARIES